MRFRKRVKIAPGVSLNVGKKSVGVRVGGRGYGVSTNTKTGTRASVGLPGSGISYSKKIGKTGSGTGCMVFLATTVATATTVVWLL